MTIHPALFHFMCTCQFSLPFFFYTSFHPFLLLSFSLTSYALVRLLPPSLSLLPLFFSSDPLFLTFTVFFSPFLIPLFIFLDIFPLRSHSLSPLFTLSLHPPFPPPPSFSSVSNEGLFSSHNQSRGWVMRARNASHARSLHSLSSDLRRNVSPATTMRVVMGTLFSTMALIAASLSPGT